MHMMCSFLNAHYLPIRSLFWQKDKTLMHTISAYISDYHTDHWIMQVTYLSSKKEVEQKEHSLFHKKFFPECYVLIHRAHNIAKIMFLETAFCSIHLHYGSTYLSECTRKDLEIFHFYAFPLFAKIFCLHARVCVICSI